MSVMAKVKVFKKDVKLQGQDHEVKNYGIMWKVLSQGIHMCNMKARVTSGKKVMVKVFQKHVKLQGQGLEVKNYVTMWKVLSQGIHMCNMKAPWLLVRQL